MLATNSGGQGLTVNCLSNTQKQTHSKAWRKCQWHCPNAIAQMPSFEFSVYWNNTRLHGYNASHGHHDDSQYCTDRSAIGIGDLDLQYQSIALPTPLVGWDVFGSRQAL